MLPYTRRQGSYYSMALERSMTQNSDLGADIGLRSPVVETFIPLVSSSPFYSGFHSGFFPINPLSPVGVDSFRMPSFHFKRMRSSRLSSFTSDASPVEVPHTSKVPRLLGDEMSPKSSGYIPRQQNRQIPRGASRSVTLPRPTRTIADDDIEDDTPLLKLGDQGRARLKAAISERVRADADCKERVDEIGKIRLASMAQLMRMAKICGLWEYALDLANSHDKMRMNRR
jgi:hypothetical protein